MAWFHAVVTKVSLYFSRIGVVLFSALNRLSELWYIFYSSETRQGKRT